MVDPKSQRSIFTVLGNVASVLGEERVFGAAAEMIKTVARTKAAVDSNVATLLGMANLPSRSEVESLRNQLEVLQASVSTLTRKINKLIEETTDKAPPRPRRAARAAGPRRGDKPATHEENSD